MPSSIRPKSLSLWLKVGLAVALVLTLVPTSSRAEMFTASGSDSSGEALSATADFEFANGVLTITLTNTLSAADLRSAGQGLSDIQFTLSSSPGKLSSTSASGQFGDINSGTVTYTTSDSFNSDTTPLRWLGEGPQAPKGSGTFSITNDTILMEALGGGQPSEMIAPLQSNSGSYPLANSSVSNFNSWVIGSATFTLDLSGVTSSTTVTSATFSFGTGPDTFLPGQSGGGGGGGGGVVPAPPSVVLLGFGGFGLAFILARSRRRLAAA